MGYQFIERTAVPAWGPQQADTLLAAGTVAGAMDATFSNTSMLEIFRLSADGAGPATAAGAVEAAARFQRLAWQAQGLEGRELGLLAGGLENGDVAFWDPAKVLAGDGDALVHASSAHTGAVCGLEFNPQQANLVASGATNGEVFIWDIVSEFKSHAAGARSQRMDSVTDLAWNNQVQHILVTASNTGALVVWDLRQHREIMALNSAGAIGSGTGRAGASAVAWNPASATQLVSASGDDNSPEIMFWDLRNANAPARTLAGHQRGILSLSWCRKDAGLLLSSGKDNRTVCWDPLNGEIVGEVPPAANWVYDVQWNQANPNLLSSASFDGRINVCTLARDADRHASTDAARAMVSDDPFAPQSTSAFAPSLSLRRPPKWLARPSGATFGFGGQLVHFGQKQATGAPALVSITELVSEPALAQQAQQLEELLQSDRAAELCQERLVQSKGTNQERSWQVLQLLFASNARDRLISFLGFDKAAVQQLIREKIAAKQQQQQQQSAAAEVETLAEAPAEAPPAAEAEADNGLFAGAVSGDAEGEDFFNQPQPAAPAANNNNDNHGSNAPQLATAADADVRALQVAFSGAFHIYDKAKDVASEDADGLVTRAVLLGDIESAVELCIEQERFADALVLATCGSAELATRAQQAYFVRRAEQASYVRLLHGIVTGDLADVVSNANIAEWDECLALLCTYAQGDQFSALCEVLGRRLEAAAQLSNAVMCYLASGNLDKVAAIWIADEQQQRHHDGASRVQCVHALVEKVSVFRNAVQFIDPAIAEEQPAFPLAPLYDVYIEYVRFLISQGLRDIADKYLQRVPTAYRVYAPTTGEDMVAAIRNRLDPAYTAPWTLALVAADASQQPTQQLPQPARQLPQQQQPQTSYSSGYPAPSSGYGGVAAAAAGYPSASMPSAQHYPASGMPAYPAPATSAAAAYPSSGYPAAPGMYAGMAQGYPAVPAPLAGVFPPPPPPLNPATIPTGLSPPPRRDEGAWNDPPMLTAKLTKRPPQPAGKPAPIVSPFPHGRDTPPPAAGARSPQHGQPPAPPPRGGFVPPPARPAPPPPPPPPAASAPFPAAHHAPPQPMAQPFQQPMAQPFQQPSHHPTMAPPQPQYIQQHQQQPARGQVVSAAPAPPPARAATPAGRQAVSPVKAAAKYPAGDRSHLPAEWKPIVAALAGHLEQAQKFAAPGQKRMVDDAARRLNLLFDMMNCDEVPVKEKLVPLFTQLVQTLAQRQHQAALAVQAELMATSTDITSHLVGVKHLISVLKTLPM
ncbi:protein transport protein S31 [Coemansia spiralis]|nr:protein transport protein S31 [Coemansia spiralis]